MKLSKHLCLECSTCAIFLSLSFTVSIMALFLSKSLSETLINAPFMLLFNLVIKTSFLLSSSSFCVLKIKFFCAIPCKLKKNNLYLRLGKNNLNVHAYEDNVDFTNFSPLDIKNATFGSQGRYAGLYEKALH